MANYYTQFSFAIPLDSPEEKEWARDVVDALLRHDAEEPIDGDDAVLADILPDEPEYIGYTAEIDDDGIWVHADESGTPSDAVLLVQAWLKRFDPTGWLAFSWANTCDRPRLDSFGGGAAFVTADDAQYLDSDQWIYDLEKNRPNPNPQGA